MVQPVRMLTSSLNVTKATLRWGDRWSREDKALYRASWTPWEHEKRWHTFNTHGNTSLVMKSTGPSFSKFNLDYSDPMFVLLSVMRVQSFKSTSNPWFHNKTGDWSRLNCFEKLGPAWLLLSLLSDVTSQLWAGRGLWQLYHGFKGPVFYK